MLNYIDETAFRAAGHVSRLPEEEDLNSYVFENADGTRTAYILAEPVKYVDSTGEIREKNLTLSQGQTPNASVMATAVNTGAYTVTATNTPMTFPNDLSQGVRFTYGDYTITLRPETVSTATTILQADGKVLYRSAFGTTAHLMYTPQLNGLKEDIVLTRYSDQNTFSFILDTDGLIPASDAGGYYLHDGTDMQIRLGQVISYDANGDFSIGEMTVMPTSGTNYRVTLTVDEDFLANAFYPVTVDPTLIISDKETYENAIEDIVLFQGKPDACYRSMQYNTVGYADATLLEGRTAFRLKGLYNGTVYSQVNNFNSVKFYVYGYTGATQNIGLYPIENTNWTENTATWNNIGDYCEDSFKTASIPTGAFGMFDITELVEEWYEGDLSAEGGFLLISDAPTAPKKIYSSENTADTSRRPYVEVNYVYETYPAFPEEMHVGETGTFRIMLTGYTTSYSLSSEDSSIVSIENTNMIGGTIVGELRANALGTTTVTITLTLLDGCTETIEKTVHVIIKDGVYIFGNDTPIRTNTTTTRGCYLRTDLQYCLRASMNTDNSLLLRYWQITHVGNRLYQITSFADESKYLMVDADNSAIKLADLHENPNDEYLWYIEKNSLNGYHIIPKSYETENNRYLTTGAQDSDSTYYYFDLAIGNPEQIEHRTWFLYEVETYGILFKSINASGVPLKTDIPGIYKDSDPFATLGKNGYEIYTYATSGIELEDITWSSDNSAVIGVSDSGVLKVFSAGTATITVTAVFDKNGVTLTDSISFSFTATTAAQGTYYLRNFGNGLFMGVQSDYDQVSNTPIIRDTPNELINPRWLIRHESDGYYVIHVYISGTHYIMTTQGSGVVLTPYPSNSVFTNNMLFQIEPLSDGMYAIFPKSHESANAVVTSQTVDAELTLTAYSTQNAYQKWIFVDSPEFLGLQILSTDAEVQYDNGYAARIGGDVLDHIERQMQDAQNFYLVHFGIWIEYTLQFSPTTTHADIDCLGHPVYNDGTNWDWEQCNALNGYLESKDDDASNEDPESNHGDASRLLDELSQTKPISVLFTGHDLCDNNEYIGGMCSPDSDMVDAKLVVEYDHSQRSELATLIHELGHVFNAPDHYDEPALEVPSTDTLKRNKQHEYYIDEEEGISYSEHCIYGEDEEYVTLGIPSADDTLTMCPGCKYQITQFLKGV